MIRHTLRLIRYPSFSICFRVTRAYRSYASSHIPQLKSDQLKSSAREHHRQDLGLKFNDPLKKSGFQEVNTIKHLEETLIQYFDFISNGFKKSKKNLVKLKKDLHLLHTDVSAKERFSYVFQFLLAETQMEIARYNSLGPQAIKNLADTASSYINLKEEAIENDDQLESAIMNDIFDDNLKDTTKTVLPYTELLLNLLGNMSKSSWEKNSELLELDNVAEAYEIAKLIPLEDMKKRGIFWGGKILYDSRKVRLDPVNESFYIDALVYFGKYKEAFKLFNTYRDKVNQRWWLELGMMIALRSNHIKAFQTLLIEHDSNYGLNGYISSKVARLAVKRYLAIRDIAKANTMTDRVLNTAKQLGIKTETANNEYNNFNSEADAYKYLNTVEPPTVHDLVSIANYHIFAKNTEKVYDIFAVYFSSVGNSDPGFEFCITKTRLTMLKNQNELETALKDRIEQNVVPSILEVLYQSYEDLRKETNMSEIIAKEIYFDSLRKLGDKKSYTLALEKLVDGADNYPIKSEVGDSDHLRNQKIIAGVIKLMLWNGQEEKASRFLTELESSSQNSKSNHKESLLNSHHYALFISHYSNKSKKHRKSLRTKVNDIIDTMHVENIQPTATFWSSLIAFYRRDFDLDAAFSIINGILQNNQVSIDDKEIPIERNFYERRVISKKLYNEIWMTYAFYYNLRKVSSVHETFDRCHKAFFHASKDICSKMQHFPEISSRCLFRRMITQDNILPEPHLYIRVIKTFLKQGDLEGLYAVLLMMTKVHGLSISESVQKYILKGLQNLKKEYISQGEQQTSDKYFDNRSLKKIGLNEEEQSDALNENNNVKEHKVFNELLELMQSRNISYKESLSETCQEMGVPYE